LGRCGERRQTREGGGLLTDRARCAPERVCLTPDPEDWGGCDLG
jgi:hypothetical protein